MDVVNNLSGQLRHEFQQCNMTLKLHMRFIRSTYFFLCLGSNTLNVNSTVILMIRIQMMCLHHCTACNKLDLNQRDWKLKNIEFGGHVFFVFVLYFLKKKFSPDNEMFSFGSVSLFGGEGGGYYGMTESFKLHCCAYFITTATIQW